MMDRRRILEKGTKLLFPGMTCTVESCVGSGSNAVVYRGWYEDQACSGARHHVLIKELNPLKKDDADTHRLSFERGSRVHLHLLENHPETIGENVNSFEHEGTLYTVLGVSGGEGLDRVIEHEGGSMPLSVHARRMLGVLDALDAFHESGYLHLDISPDNILLIRAGAQERMLLIDYNSVCTAEECRNGEMPYLSVKDGYSAPEITTGRIESIGRQTDLYALTAVFFTCLTGRALQGIVEKRKCGVTAALESECLRGAPETVRSMAASVLCRGLHPLPQNRYQTTEQMRSDLLELLDRIECVGVTHWAIWEKSRSNLLQMIAGNPSLSHVAQEEGLYPAAVRNRQGSVQTLSEFTQTLLEPEGKNAALISAGGMGKTTALLRMALLQNSRYSPRRAAAVYVSAYNYTQDDPSFIRNSILGMLRFNRSITSYEEVRHELDRLMRTPYVKDGKKYPVLLIALDGINEASGDLTLLRREMEELCAMEGVRLIAASRSDAGADVLSPAALIPLSEETIRENLSRNGLRMPENETLRKLLCTPMVLSIFIRASREEGGQLRIHTANELIEAYLRAMLRKEMGTENSPRRFMLEAAVYFVLPSIAGQTLRRKRALTPVETLEVVEKCYRLVGSKGLLRAFPEWIGHSREIIGGAMDAEEWYGLIIVGVLKGSMGLIAAEDQGGMRIAHQMIEEYLGTIAQKNRKNINRQRLMSRAKGLAAAAALAAAVFAYRLMGFM